jgi:anthranilate synthase component 1
MQPEVVTTAADFAATAADAAARDRVPIEARLTADDPFLAYRRVRSGTGGAYLDTTGGQRGWGYFGVDPIEIRSVEVDEGSSLDQLSALVDETGLTRGECAVPYPCGAIGWLSYDIARELESLPDSADRDRALPRLQVAVYETLVSWEEPRDDEVELHVTNCPVVDEPGDESAVAQAYEQGRDAVLSLAEQIQHGDPKAESAPADAATAAFESDCGRAAFRERVKRVKAHIRDGETFQANISQRLRAPAAVHPVAVFDALRSVNPAPYSALLEFPGVDLVSASPELLLEREGRRLVTEPIAGTRPRGATETDDQRLEDELRTDEKERAEHAMLVDLERNDLGKVCEYGSVDVSEYRRVDRYSAVMHLVSLVEGRLRPEHDLADAIAAVFPGGTITGAPKPRTMEIIDEVEATRRGPYTGSIGIVGFDERATLNITIRTLVRDGEEYHLRVGAGIVNDSDPDGEYTETLDKARGLINAVDAALGERADLEVGGS